MLFCLRHEVLRSNCTRRTSFSYSQLLPIPFFRSFSWITFYLLSSSSSPRHKFRFIDSAVIESDCEGGDISSTAITPDCTLTRARKPSTSSWFRSALPSGPKLYIHLRFKPLAVASSPITKPPSAPLAILPISPADLTYDLCPLKFFGLQKPLEHSAGKKCRVVSESQSAITPGSYCQGHFQARRNRENQYRTKTFKLIYSLHFFPSWTVLPRSVWISSKNFAVTTSFGKARIQRLLSLVDIHTHFQEDQPEKSAIS